MQKNKELQSKACTLLKFMYYDWGNDAKFKDYTKDHVPTKGDEKAQKEEMEGIKRNYYSQYVDKDFEKTFEFNSEEDKFRDQEADLRVADLELQNSMIKFSQFLQDNEKKKAEADKKQSDEKNVSGR